MLGSEKIDKFQILALCKIIHNTLKNIIIFYIHKIVFNTIHQIKFFMYPEQVINLRRSTIYTNVNTMQDSETYSNLTFQCCISQT